MGWAEWVSWGVTSGYGTKLTWILGWSLLIWLIFALIYVYAADLRRRSHPQSESDFVFRLRLLDFPRHYLTGPDVLGTGSKPGNRKTGEPEISTMTHGESGASQDGVDKRTMIWNVFRFSFVVLFKVGYRDTTVSGRILGFDLKYVIMLEWLLGYLLIAGLTVTLANTQPLLNRLLGGLI